jgi:hypothetical protein
MLFKEAVWEMRVGAVFVGKRESTFNKIQRVTMHSAVQTALNPAATAAIHISMSAISH